MKRRIATVVSLVGHPFVVAPCTVAVTVRPARVAVTIVGVTMLFMLGVIARRVAKGHWSDYDVSDRRQRHGFYPIALSILVAAAVAAWLFHLPRGFLHGMLAVVTIVAIAAVLTRWTKVSLHLLIDSFCTAIGAGISLPLAIGLGALTLVVAWSRLALRRHTPLEVVLGALLGAAGGTAVVLMH